MNYDLLAIALTVIGLLGTLASVLTAVFYRLGSFQGQVHQELETLHTDLKGTRSENNEAHQTIYTRLQTDHDHVSEKLAIVHGRLSALEERTAHNGGK